MSVIAIAAFAAAVLAYVMSSEALGRIHITAPIVFIGVGGALGAALAHQPDHALVRGLAKLTLALLLFHDAAQVQPHQLRGDLGVCSRLLLIALPLTIAAGFVLSRMLFPGTSTWVALLLAAALGCVAVAFAHAQGGAEDQAKRPKKQSASAVGAGLVPARIGRRPMIVIALSRDPGRDKPCPYTTLIGETL